MADKFTMKATGFGELRKNLRNISHSTVKPQSGIGAALKKGADDEIVPRARAYIWVKFDTSGDFPTHVKTVLVNQFRCDIVVDDEIPYGAVHEFGGTFKITEKQRSFFWAKWYETQNEMWKALALSVTYTIPARPYLRPAIDEKHTEAMGVAARELYLTWRKVVGI